MSDKHSVRAKSEQNVSVGQSDQGKKPFAGKGKKPIKESKDSHRNQNKKIKSKKSEKTTDVDKNDESRDSASQKIVEKTETLSSESSSSSEEEGVSTVAEWVDKRKITIAKADLDLFNYARQHGYQTFKVDRVLNPHSISALERTAAVHAFLKIVGREKRNIRVLSWYGADRDTFISPGQREKVAITWDCCPNTPIEGDASRMFRSRKCLDKHQMYDGAIFTDVYQEGNTPWQPLSEETIKMLCQRTLDNTCYGVVRIFQGEMGADVFEWHDGMKTKSKTEGCWFRKDGLINFMPEPRSQTYPAHPDINWILSRTWEGIDVSFVQKFGPYWLVQFSPVKEDAQKILSNFQQEGNVVYKELEASEFVASRWWLTFSSWWWGEQCDRYLVHVPTAVTLVPMFLMKPLNGMTYDSVSFEVQKCFGADKELKALEKTFPTKYLELVQGTTRYILFNDKEKSGRSLLLLRRVFSYGEKALAEARSATPPPTASNAFVLQSLGAAFLMGVLLYRRWNTRKDAPEAGMIDILTQGANWLYENLIGKNSDVPKLAMEDLEQRLQAASHDLLPGQVELARYWGKVGVMFSYALMAIGGPMIEETFRGIFKEKYWIYVIFEFFANGLVYPAGIITSFMPLILHAYLQLGMVAMPNLFGWTFRTFLHSLFNTCSLVHSIKLKQRVLSAPLGYAASGGKILPFLLTALIVAMGREKPQEAPKKKPLKVIPASFYEQEAPEFLNDSEKRFKIASEPPKVEAFFESYYSQKTHEAQAPIVLPISPNLYIPAVTSKWTDDTELRGVMKVHLNGRKIDWRELVKKPLPRIDVRVGMYPICITNALLWQPDNNPTNLVVCLASRIHKDVHDPAIYGTVEDRISNWTSAFEILSASLQNVVTHIPTIEDCAIAMGGPRGRRLLEANEKDVEGRNLKLPKTYNVKWNETITSKNFSGGTTIKPRAICNLDPIYHSRTAPYARAMSDLMHFLFDGTKIYKVHNDTVGTLGIRIWYCSGYTNKELSRMKDQMNTSMEICLAVNGDDSYLQTPLGSFEGDFSSMDQSQDDGATKVFMPSFERKIGVPEEIINIWLKTVDMDYKVKKKKYDFQIMGNAGVQLETGKTKTTVQNSAINIGYFLYSVTNSENPFKAIGFSEIANTLGLTLKIKDNTLKPHQSTFLKGWWIPSACGSIWMPLPSQFLKLGKILRDPCELFPCSDRGLAIRNVAKEFALAFPYIPRQYPIYGALFDLYDKIGIRHKEKHLEPNLLVENYAYKSNFIHESGFSYLDVDTCYAMMSQRYLVTEEDLRGLDEMIRNTKTLPVYMESAIFGQLAAVDYG